eukprot:754827-Hanusia_phi.AAC.2
MCQRRVCEDIQVALSLDFQVLFSSDDPKFLFLNETRGEIDAAALLSRLSDDDRIIAGSRPGSLLDSTLIGQVVDRSRSICSPVTMARRPRRGCPRDSHQASDSPAAGGTR